MDIATDPLNCGRCGRSCLGGTCAGGFCPIDDLTPMDDVGSNVATFAVDDTYLYWGSAKLPTTPSDAIEKVVKTGGSVSVVLAITAPQVTVHGGWIYYTSKSMGIVGRVQPDGTANATLASGEPTPRAIVADDTFAYYNSTTSGVGVRRVSVTGGTGAPFGTTPSSSLGLCEDQTTVYWSCGSSVYSEDKSGTGGLLTLATGQSSPGRPTVDSTWVYFTDDSSGFVNRVPKIGGNVQQIVPNQNMPGEALIVGSRLYWLQKPLGYVMSANPDGSDVEVMAAQQGWVQAFTSDGTYLYWTQPDAGSVTRIWRTPI